MKTRFLSTLFIALLLNSPAALASEASVLFDAAVRERAQALSLAVEQGETGRAVAGLEALVTDPALRPAQRDAVAWDLVRRLRRLDAEQVPAPVMARLVDWSAQALRRHEESPIWTVPLFDVARAARGLENQWLHAEGLRDAMGRGADLLTWVERYAELSESAYRRGVHAGLLQAPVWQLEKIVSISRDDPRLLDSLLPELWLAQGRVSELGAWLRQAPADLAGGMLNRARRVLPPEEFLQLGEHALIHPDASVRSLALAHQTDAWLDLDAWPAVWARSLWARRADPALAPAADLQLVRLEAPARWQSDPASAPAGALGSEAFEGLRSLARSLGRDAGGVR
ncbi:hypothetical protein AY599_24620 [Leptolyngbya valderiana BDU 20041]|nr:hypothetical protein AY599_24620 [Leptolyngbya valderiana BDU 20041]